MRQSFTQSSDRRRHSRGERESLHSPQDDRVRDAARQRAAATRRRETDDARAERRPVRGFLSSVSVGPRDLWTSW